MGGVPTEVMEETTDLLQRLIRNSCVNEGTAESGHEIRSDVIDAQRDALAAMRDRGAIDDDVLRSIERELDLEEIRMEA